MASIAKERVKAAAFSQLPETNQPTELIDGEIIQMAAPKNLHQRISGRLFVMLAGVVKSGDLFFSPSDVYLDEYNVVQPDIFWVSGPDSLCKAGEDDYWHGAPDLVIEILSESTTLRDRREKFALYEKHGTREYWLVDPAGKYVEVWERTGKEFRRHEAYGPQDSFESTVLGGAKIDLQRVFEAEKSAGS